MIEYILLGSQSPRRKEILSYFTLPFTQRPPAFDEESILFSGDPVNYAKEIAEGKANSIESDPGSIALTADTVVFCNDKVYGKPKSLEEAHQTLAELSGNWHTVVTAVSLKKEDKIITDHEETRILFNELSPEHIADYCQTVKWADKAGGYAIQNNGGLIINRIEGCYFNTMGLPINTVRKLLLNFGIDLWDYLV